MTSITYRVGDATRPQHEGQKIIAHICNDSGAWGRGFVLALSKRSKEPESAFRSWVATGHGFRLGAVQFVGVDQETEVANIIGQHGITRKNDPPNKPPPVRYEAIQEGLRAVAERALERGATVHMPRIGAGLAGGKWEVIASIIEDELCARDVEVFVYDLA